MWVFGSETSSGLVNHEMQRSCVLANRSTVTLLVGCLRTAFQVGEAEGEGGEVQHRRLIGPKFVTHMTSTPSIRMRAPLDYTSTPLGVLVLAVGAPHTLPRRVLGPSPDG